MKVLFAVNNENVSESIIKKYQSMYKEIISWKNVYYFNAIIKELQKDKSYDRIVIGEDLEPYTNNNYEVIDNFLFDKLDAISDEASNSTEGDIPIILIATDRREKKDSILIKLFGIGIYNVLLGRDRSMENVCRLIAQPRTKKEAKVYYGIESDDIEYQSVNPDTVPEDEMNNIIRHYKRIGNDEERFVYSFDDIAAQYNQAQLKIIAAKLPLNVRAVLEEKSPKYQQVMIGSVKGKAKEQQAEEQKNRIVTRDINGVQNNRIGLINEQLQKGKITKPVVIPSSVNLQNVEKVYKEEPKAKIAPSVRALEPKENTEPTVEELVPFEASKEIEEKLNNIENVQIEEAPKRGRGRPKKEVAEPVQEEVQKPKRGRGRPKKNVEPEEMILPGLQEEPIDRPQETEGSYDKQQKNKEERVVQPVQQVEPVEEEPIDLFGLANNESSNQADDTFLPGFEETMQKQNVAEPVYREPELKPINNNYENNMYNSYNNYSETNNEVENNQTSLYNTEARRSNLSNLLVGNKKIVAFVGTSKNGTSFLVNNLATLLSEKGIKTAILDLTENKNAYYIYNMNDDNLRNKAFNCIENLRSGIADGIPAGKNLTVYTTLPGNNPSLDDCENILSTLVENYSLILLDCDFNTNIEYFVNAQEIYLVQTYDILTIQPLTAFLNELQHKNVLDESKLRIVLNKTLNLRKLTDRMVIGGISCYNDPATTYQNNLFNKDTIRYTNIPFEDQTYAKYLERLVDCEVTLKGYSKAFLTALNKLGDMVYPLIANSSAPKNYNDYSKANKKQSSTQFNNNMNETLNKMRRNF